MESKVRNVFLVLPVYEIMFNRFSFRRCMNIFTSLIILWRFTSSKKELGPSYIPPVQPDQT